MRYAEMDADEALAEDEAREADGEFAEAEEAYRRDQREQA